MSDYVPTIDEVRDRYADARVGIGEWTRFDESVKRAVEDAYAEFARMIAEVERAAAARALDLAASDWAADPDAWGDNEKDYRNELRARAAEIREGKSDGES